MAVIAARSCAGTESGWRRERVRDAGREHTSARCADRARVVVHALLDGSRGKDQRRASSLVAAGGWQ